MVELLRAKVLNYQHMAEEALQIDDENGYMRAINELHGFRTALELVLSQNLIREIFRKTEE